MKHKASRYQKKRIIAAQTDAAPSSIIPTSSVAHFTRGSGYAAFVYSVFGAVNACLRRLALMPAKIKRWLKRYALEVALFVTLFALFVFLGVFTWIYMQAPSTIAMQQEHQRFIEQAQREQSTEAAQRAWQRLHRQHGFPGTVVYEPGKTPWYKDKQGRKCSFI